jgi:hypothetical protein
MRKSLLLLTALTLLLTTGCSNKGEAYKKKILPLYDSLVKIRNDIQNGKLSPTFSDDCDAAKSLLDRANADLPGEDTARPSFVHMQDALEGYIALRSIAAKAPPDKITLMATGSASDLEKAKSSLDKGD